jgi:hypothetical protein
MSAKPLSKREREWLDELEAVLMKCPSRRLACFTIGDQDLHFYDQTVSLAWEKANPRLQLDAGPIHEAAGSALRIVNANFNIDSCSG